MVCLKEPVCPSFELTLELPWPNRERIAQRHRDEFRASGISDQLINRSGTRTVSSAEVCQMLNWSQDPAQVGSGWAIPFDDPNDENCYWRVKLDEPRKRSDDVIKYESPVGSANRAYLPPGFDASQGARIVITEGEKKALSAVDNGFNCLGLTGCWNYQKRRNRDENGRAYGKRHLIDDLVAIDWKDRDVIICFDSDAAEKQSVEMAQQKLAELLASHGAKVKVARLPGGAGDKKLGLDDAIVELGVEAVAKIIEDAETPELPKLSWVDLARMLIENHLTYGGYRTLLYWRDTFWRWNGRHHEEVAENEVYHLIYRFLESIGWSPNRGKTMEVLTALKVEVGLDPATEPPCWLKHPDTPLSDTPQVFTNLVVTPDYDCCGADDEHWTDEPMPDWFYTGAKDFEYHPTADCPTWKKFLGSSLPDPDARKLLQQWAGYLISGRMDRQKLMTLVGAPRSGKSIIANTLAAVVGYSSTATSTLKEISSDFGLWPLVGKHLLLIPDASDRGSCISAVERLKAISGCDALSVNRKHLPILNNVRLNTRIMITANQLPRFLDSSGALHRRLLLINFQISFAGREDRSLSARIKLELPGIFNWALRGWIDLRDSGEFIEPESSREVLDEAEQVFSPISVFLEECCTVDANSQVPIDQLWAAWQKWCSETGRPSGSREKLGTDLRSRLPEIERVQIRVGDARPRVYRGLKLSPPGERLVEDWNRTAYRRA